MHRTVFMVLVLLHWSGIALSAALLPIEGAPFKDLYDVYYITEDNKVEPNIAVVPKTVELQRDDASGKVNVGLQYLYETGSPSFAQLTASLRLRYEKSEVDQIVGYVRGLGEIAGEPKVVSLGAFSWTVQFFFDDGKNIETKMGSQNPVAIGATMAASVDLSSISKEQLQLLVGGSKNVGGFVGFIESPLAIVERSNDSASWRAVIKWVSRNPVLTNAELNYPDDPAIRAAPEIRQVVAASLGPPQIVRSPTGYVFGWDMLRSDNAEKLVHLVEGANGGTFRRIANGYFHDSLLPLNILCSTYPGQVLNISTSEVGCGGLSE